MFRITVEEGDDTQRWFLQGWLMGPWVSELKANWEASAEGRRSRRCVVDVSEVMCLDPAGELLLQRMLSEGAEVTGCGVYTKQLLADLGRKCRQHG